MLDLKVRDLPLRGRKFTLFVAAKERGVDDDLINCLAHSIYPEYKEDDPSYDQLIPSQVDTRSFEDKVTDYGYDLKIFEELELITIKGEVTILTEKAEEIFNRATKIREELYANNFYFCPCDCFC